jgi:CO/xanthine dehydrogenase Mo-binding subunit
MHDESGVKVYINGEGVVSLVSAVSELGEGITMTLAMIVSEAFGGLDLDQIKLNLNDTTDAPDSGLTAASRQTTMTGMATHIACESLSDRLRSITSELLDVSPDQLRWENGALTDSKSSERAVSLQEMAAEAQRIGIELIVEEKFVAPPTVDLDEETGQGGTPINSFSYATVFADVEVDTDTGDVKVLKLTSVNDAGTIINLEGAEAQVEGGLIMGLGFALTEDYIYNNAVPATKGFTEYTIPTMLDYPEIETYFVESAHGFGPYGAKGLGELPTVSAAPAILNAIHDAVGVYIHNLPATPERILRALREQ